jgi:hypothetical protein
MATFAPPLYRVIYNGVPAAAATITVYQSGTTTPVTIYTDAALTQPAGNPITCDANGEAAFYASTAFALRFLVKTSGGTTVRDLDPVYVVPVLTGLTATGSQLNVTAVTAGTAAAAKALVLDANKDATQVRRLGTTEGYYSPYCGFKNAVIGGDFGTNPWQRGTSFAAVANAAYTADRWAYYKSGTMAHTASRDTDAPAVGASQGAYSNPFHVTHSHRLNLTTPQASIAAGEYCYLAQRVEGYAFQALARKPFTLSFWVRSTLSGTYAVAFRNSGTDRSYVATYTINAADTWEFKSVAVSASPSAGTWDYATGVGVEVIFTLAAGSTYQTTEGSWQAGSFLAPTGYANHVASGHTDLRVALVQLESGPADTLFERRPAGAELLLCQRYFQAVTGNSKVVAPGQCTSSTTATVVYPLPVTMRAAPSLGPLTASHFLVTTNSGGTASCTAVSLDAATHAGCAKLSATVSSGLTAGDATWMQTQNASATLYLSAEL